VITPDDIDSLFTKSKNADAEGDEDEEYEDEEDSTADEGVDTESSEYEYDEREVQVVEQAASSSLQSYSPSSMAQEEIPKWLSDADKAAKQSRKLKRKNKGLTDDWRFWLALVGGVGFLSAAWSVYSQTGFSMGPLPSPQELII